METVTDSTKEKNSMKSRAITAVIFVAACIMLAVLKWCIPGGWGAFAFDAAFCAVSVLGCLEFLRAIDLTNAENSRISLPQRAFTIAFCAVAIPLYVAVEMTMHSGLLAVVCAFAVYAMFLAATAVFDHGRSTVKNTIYCVFCMLYCGVLSTMLTTINRLPQNSMVALLVLFTCTMLTDTGAFVVGSIFKRWIPLKLAPKLSPNKTVIGAVGGIIGGILGALLAFYTMKICGGFAGSEPFVFRMNDIYLTFTSEAIAPEVCFVLVGLFTSVLAQVGDLFESAIKRECGIKDMGNLLPGHGGVLDRFDSMLYCGLVVLFSFGTVII